MKMKRWLLLAVLFAACASQRSMQTVKAFREARDRFDDAAASKYVAPGSPLAKGGAWRHWDEYFHGHTTWSGWTAHGRVVSAYGDEMNDFYRYLDWKVKPYKMTWWLDENYKVEKQEIEPDPEKATSRLEEFKAWAAKAHPDELEYLMPKGQIDPSADRPERWRKILEEWHATMK